MKKKALVVLLIMALVLSFALCGCGSNEEGGDAAAEVYPIKIAHLLTESDDVHLGFLELQKMLEERSEGRFQVEIFPNGTLAGNDDESAELVNSNAVQIACIALYNTANLSDKLLKFNVLDLPYLFQTDEDYYKFLDSEYGQAMLDEVLAATGNIWAHTNYVRSWQALTLNDKEVRVPADLAGQTIITGAPEVFVKTVQAWGGNLGTVPFSESYTAMQQGSIDGNLRAINLAVTKRYFEVQNYVTLVNQSAMANTTLISKSWYDSLPDDLKAIFDEAIMEYQQIMRDYGVTRQEETIKQLADEGMTIVELTDAEKQEWIDASACVWDQMESVIGKETIDAAREILGR